MLYQGKTTVAEFCNSVVVGSFGIVYVSSSYTIDITGLPSQNAYYINVYKSTTDKYGLFVAFDSSGLMYFYILNPYISSPSWTQIK